MGRERVRVAEDARWQPPHVKLWRCRNCGEVVPSASPPADASGSVRTVLPSRNSASGAWTRLTHVLDMSSDCGLVVSRRVMCS